MTRLIKEFSLFVILGFAAVVCARGQQMTVHVDKAGSLATLVSGKDMCTVKSLTVTGYVNGTDVRFIRNLAGGGVTRDGSYENRRLERLDLSGARIMAGGDYYLKDSMRVSETPPYDYHYFYDRTKNNTVSDRMFYGCTALRSVRLPESVTHIGSCVFGLCSVDSVVIPGSVTSVDDRAFTMTKIRYTRLGRSLTYLDIDVLSPWTEAIDVDEANPSYASADGVLFDKAMTTLLRYPENRTGTAYIVPSTVKTIGDEAFYMNQNITKIDLPDGLETIGRWAFHGSTVVSLTLPESLKSIGSQAFDDNLLWLRSVTCQSATPADCADDAFPEWYDFMPGEAEWDNAANIILYVPKGCVDRYKTAHGFDRVKDIREIGSATGIGLVSNGEKPTVTARYATDGTLLDKPRRGVNIVRMSDGSVKKVTVK